MSSSKNTFIAFLLNLSFSIIEFIFGWLFGSSAILADALHDLGDALAIGSSAMMQAYADRPADSHYPFGYKRWNSLAALLTSSILIMGSSFILLENIPKLLNPQPVDQDGMLVLGIIAVMTNLLASHFLKNGHSHNESILSLHFLEDILGWLAVILVSTILQFTDWYILDPLLSLAIAIFILHQALPQVWRTLKIFLETSPQGLDSEEVRKGLLCLENVAAVHQLSIWTLDGVEHCASLTLSIDDPAMASQSKQAIRTYLEPYGIEQSTIEIL